MSDRHIRPVSWNVVVVVAASVFAVVVGLIASPAAADLPGYEGEVVAARDLPSILSSQYRISVGDVLNIGFFKATEMSQKRTVGPDGEIFLPLVGRVKVVGRTVDDVTREVTEGYLKEMINPQITVSVEEFSGLSVYVGGEVNQPGMLDYRGGFTLVQAINAAGGFNRRARRQEVLLIRPGPENKPVGTIVDVKKILRRGQYSDDVSLAPLDIIYVHHKKIINLNIFVQQYISDNLPQFGAWMYYLPGYGQ